MKRSSSQFSLDNISIDSNLLEEHLVESDGSDPMEAGLEDFSSLNYQSTVDTASVELRNEEYCVSSPDVGSAADESTHDSKQELMSVVVFKISGVNGAIDIKGEDVTICLQVNQVVPKQLGNVSVWQYLNNRSMGSDQKSSSVEEKESSPEISLRLETGPSAKRYSLLAAENGFLQCQVTDFTSEFLTSTLANIRHFVEDDSVAEVMPMKIKVQRVRLHLKDDSPRNNNSEQQPEPLMFNIENLLVERYDDGSFSIRGNPDASTSSTSNNKELNHIGSINCDHTKSIQHRSNATKCTQTLCDNPVQAEPIEGNKSYNQKAMAVSTEQADRFYYCLRIIFKFLFALSINNSMHLHLVFSV
ncbi:hypothetical protein AB205_0071660 [Aquarana catesbeiana]|uniref:Uncharacterized protein n=1 Tax=Aquarana catesbeiana TaxID=8400 RepID=A0A2G9SBV1_AQUCT|nr:hypothetical protein AB205_0071660 [Aquarana catesbeiana]